MNLFGKNSNSILTPWLFLLVLLAVSNHSVARTAYCVVEPITDELLLPNTRWEGLNCKNEIKVVAAKNEIEPGSVVIRSSEIQNISVYVTDLRSDKAIFPNKNIDIKYVKVWYQSGSAWTDIRQKNKNRILVPELLVNDPELVSVDHQTKKNFLKLNNGSIRDITINKDRPRHFAPSIDDWPIKDAEKLQSLKLGEKESHQIWLRFDVPREADPGVYSGALMVNSGEEKIEIPIRLEVKDFTLEEPIIEYSLYYRGILGRSGTISSEKKTEQQILTDLINMRRHGVDNPTIYQSYTDRNGLDRILALREQVGISNKNLYYLGLTTGNPKDQYGNFIKKEYLSGLKSTFNKYGVENVFIYGIDEAKEDDIVSQYEIWRSLRGEGYKIFTAAYKEGREKFLSGKIDLVVNGRPISSAYTLEYKSKGTKSYLYNRPQVGLENPLVYRVNYGFKAWQADYDGVMNYAYQDGFGFIWDDFDHQKYRDHVFAYPTMMGPIDTLAWEGFREAVDDARYLKILLNTISNPILSESDVKKGANRIIDELKNSSILSVNEIRERIIIEIEALNEEVRRLEAINRRSLKQVSPPSQPNISDIKVRD